MVNDEMALKPAGQIDYNTRTVTGKSKTIDIKFIKENPVMKPEVIKDLIDTPKLVSFIGICQISHSKCTWHITLVLLAKLDKVF